MPFLSADCVLKFSVKKLLTYRVRYAVREYQSVIQLLVTFTACVWGLQNSRPEASVSLANGACRVTVYDFKF